MGRLRITKANLEEPRRRVSQDPAYYLEACANLLNEVFRLDKRPCTLCPLPRCRLSKSIFTERDCSVFRILYQIRLVDYCYSQDKQKNPNPCEAVFAVRGLHDMGICLRGRRRLGAPLFGEGSGEASGDKGEGR